MVREILFRGKRVDGGEWAEGILINSPHTRLPIIRTIADKCCLPVNICLVDPDTIGQYTGLKDKNGERVFEGDIWSCNGCNGVIRWSQEDCAFVADYTICGIEYENAVCESRAKVSEIIGNIHDNPELLKAE